MARGKKTEKVLTPEEKLAQALVPAEEQPYSVPENWCWVRLGSLGYTNIGLTYKPSDTSNKGTIVLRSSNIQDGQMDYEDIVKVDMDIPESKMSKSGDILICARNGSKSLVGKTAIIDRDGMSYGAFMAIFRSPYNKLIYYYLNSHYFRNIIDSDVGTTTINQVTQQLIKELPFPLPPLAEQQRIVTRIESLFAKLDEAKEKAQAVVDSFETRKAAILHKAFAGDLTVKWRLAQGIDIADWDTVILSDVCKINPPKVNTKDLPDDLEVSFFPMPALSEVYGEITEPQTKQLKEVRTGFTNFSEGDVVFAKITPCMENGKSAIIGKLVNDIGFGTTEFYVLRCGDKLLNRYLYHIVRNQSFRDEAKSMMTGAVGQQRVPKGFLEQYPLCLPSVPEQKLIVQLLDNLIAKEQRATEAAEAIIDQIDTMKKAILARAFRGELGTNDPAEESAVELLKSVL